MPLGAAPELFVLSTGGWGRSSSVFGDDGGWGQHIHERGQRSLRTFDYLVHSLSDVLCVSPNVPHQQTFDVPSDLHD